MDKNHEFIEEKSIDQVLTKGEHVYLHYPYETNLLKDGLLDIYYGFIFTSPIIIAAIIVTIAYGIRMEFFLIYGFLAIVPLFFILRGYIKNIKIINTLEYHPDDLKHYKEYFIVTNKRWIQKSSICMGIKPRRNLLFKNPNTLYQLFKNLITEYEFIDLFRREDEILFIDLKHIELRYVEYPPMEGWLDMINMRFFLKINDEEYILLGMCAVKKKRFKKFVKDMNSNITANLEPTEDKLGIIVFS